MDVIVIKFALDIIKKVLKFWNKKLSKKEYKQLISSAVAELLKEHPDIDAAEAKIIAADATGVSPSAEMLRTRKMLGKAKSFGKAKKKAVKRKAAAKKVTKKKAVPKKATKKRASKRKIIKR